MSFLKSYRQKNGDFITIQWTLGEYALAKLLGLAALLYFLGIVALIIPILWLFIYFTSIEEQRPAANIIGIVASVYMLVDYHIGLMNWSLLIPFFGEEVFKKIIYFIFGLMIAHIVLLFFGRRLYNYIEVLCPDSTESQVFMFFIIYTIAIIFGGYLVGQIIIESFISMAPYPYYNGIKPA